MATSLQLMLLALILVSNLGSAGFLGPGGNALPFDGDVEVEAFLRNAEMKIMTSSWIAIACMFLFLAVSRTFAGPPTIVDGVLVDEEVDSGSGSRALPAPAALTSSSIDFDTPELFSDTLPLRIFQTFRSGAVFFGKGVVLDAASFEVTGTSGTSILAFNGRTAVNGDGSIPQLPELILFVKPNLLGISRKQTVSVDVASKRDGRRVRLLAFNIALRLVDSDSVLVTPQMQTLTVSTATPQIVLIALRGEPELKVLAVDNLIYN